MEHIYARLTGAGMFGAAVSAFGSFIAWLTADETHKLLANALMLCCLISAIIAIVAALVRLCITQHKNNKAAIEEAQAESRLCDRCRLEKKPPLRCPITHPPADCPLRRQSKFTKIYEYLKRHGLIFKDETTTKLLIVSLATLIAAGCQTSTPVKPKPVEWRYGFYTTGGLKVYHGWHLTPATNAAVVKLMSSGPMPPSPPTNRIGNTNWVYVYHPSTNWIRFTGTNLGLDLLIRTSNSVTVGITNTTTNGVYSIWRTASLTGVWSQVGGEFVGSNHWTTVTFTETNQTRFYRAFKEPGFVIWSTSTTVYGGNDDCAGNYAGYCVFTKPLPAWGWYIFNFAPHTATEIQRTDATVAWLDYAGPNGCAPNSVIVTPSGDAFRFTEYFSSTPPASPHPLWLQGFTP